MKSLIEKLHLHHYLDSRLVLIFDIIVSDVASLCALGLFYALLPDVNVSTKTTIQWLVHSTLISAIMFYVLKTYKSVIRYSTLREIFGLSLASIGKGLFLTAFAYITSSKLYGCMNVTILSVMDFALTMCFLILTRVMMIVAYDLVVAKLGHQNKRKRVLVYGIKEKSVSLLERLRTSPHYEIVGFISPAKDSNYRMIANLKVNRFSKSADVIKIKRRMGADAILFAKAEDAMTEQFRLMEYANECGMKVLFCPTIDEVIHGHIEKPSIREIKIEDLLPRPEININMEEIKASFTGKVILVTGAAGSIGSELCRQLANLGIKKLILFDNAETPMHNLRLELEEKFPNLDFVPFIGDVRHLERLDYAFRNYKPQVVFQAAAYKHVPLMEENPCEAVRVNVTGTRNVANKCVEYGVELMVMVSTDKAVNPTNIMGCTKRLAEIYVQSLGLAIEQGKIPGKTKFVTTRFGNVLGSNGSVIPLFRKQIAKGGPVTVTHPEITRFFMTIPEACRLVMEAATMTDGNQIFVFDMGRSVKIADMARNMIQLAGLEPDKDIKIEYTGLRPGEKLYEEVLSNAENTIPTEHGRIRIAKVREYDYEEANQVVDALQKMSIEVNVPDMVRLMKRTVPEFKSQNSEFEKYDEELENKKQA